MKIQNLLFLLLCGFLANVVTNAQESDNITENADGTIEIPGATIGRMGAPAAVNPDEFAEAEEKLWLADHLANIERPVRLFYEFTKTGTYEEGFTDSIYLDIISINDDGTKNANLEFFTAERRQKTNQDNLTNITGNPILVVYMQGDVYEMNRLTSGSWRYFQRRIKTAFAENASVEPVKFNYGEKEVTGEKITIVPYQDDPRRRQFEDFADKRYEFILSDNVPGTLYQIKTFIPDKKQADKPLLQEVLTLQDTNIKS